MRYLILGGAAVYRCDKRCRNLSCSVRPFRGWIEISIYLARLRTIPAQGRAAAFFSLCPVIPVTAAPTAVRYNKTRFIAA